MAAVQILINLKPCFSYDIAKLEDVAVVRIGIHFVFLSVLFCVLPQKQVALWPQFKVAAIINFSPAKESLLHYST